MAITFPTPNVLKRKSLPHCGHEISSLDREMTNCPKSEEETRKLVLILISFWMKKVLSNLNRVVPNKNTNELRN